MQYNLKNIIAIALISTCLNASIHAAQWHEKPGDQKPLLFDVNDVIYYTNPGTVVYIYKNQSTLTPQQKIPLGMGVNYTLY